MNPGIWRSAIVAAAFGLFAAAAPAAATLVRVGFSGVFDDNEAYQIVDTPYPYSGSFIYDSTAAPDSLTATRAVYTGRGGFTFTEFGFHVPRYRITIQQSSFGAFFLVNAPCSFPDSVCGASIFAILPDYAGLALPADPAVFTGQAMELTFTRPVLDPFGQYMGDRDENYGPGSFSAAVVSAPEPGTWALLILGFGGIGGIARTRRRTAIPASV